jgi:ligand-binding SRPBCC domain-containing protein
MPQFESRVPLNASPEDVFDYILRPANLQAIAPPETQFVFVQPPEIIELGSRLICKVQAHGMIQQLSYEIVEFAAPHRFREQMIEGPLRLWLHDYIVEPNPDGGVTLVNRIEFEPPGGLMGLIVTPNKILEALEDGFYYRRGVLQKVFA